MLASIPNVINARVSLIASKCVCVLGVSCVICSSDALNSTLTPVHLFYVGVDVDGERIDGERVKRRGEIKKRKKKLLQGHYHKLLLLLMSML